MTSPDVPAPEIEVLPNAEGVVDALVTRLLARLTEIQGRGEVPQVCLTGGRIATAAYRRLAEAGGSSDVDWTRVDLWWGDERFVPDGSDRNARPALDVLLPLGFAAERVHEMPAPGSGLDLDAAAAAYDRELGSTRFDVCLLSLGPDGHIASLFPDHPSSSAGGRVVAVRDSPKPPPDRLSLSPDVLNDSAEIWFLVSGEDKAEATALALQGADAVQLPGAGAHGRDRTLWLIDRAAATRLPPDLTERGRF